MRYLSCRKVSHFADELASRAPRHTIFREVTCEQLIEKHAMMDVLHFGKELFEGFEDKQFDSTYEIIRRYADPQAVDSLRIAKLRALHFELMKKYQQLAEQEYSHGRAELEKEFLRKMSF